MISFTVNKNKYIFQCMQYFSAVITQKRTSWGFYWVSNRETQLLLCQTLLEEERPALTVRQAEHMNFLSWLLQRRRTNMFLTYHQMQISASQGRFPQGLWLRSRNCAANYWLFLAAESSEWIHCGLGVVCRGIISAARTDPGVSETRTDALSGVKLFSMVLLSHKDKP